MRSSKVFLLVALVALASACAQSSNPAAPGPLGSTSDTGPGAVVTGTVGSSSGVPAALTVQVVGTSLATNTGPFGQFTLYNVPARTVDLRFTGPGTDARITLSQLSEGQTITIVVQVAGSSAVIQAEDRSGRGNSEARLRGTVERLTGGASAFTFFIGTTEVRGGSQTEFNGEGSSAQGFANLRNGRIVEVRGSLTGNVLSATRVHFEDDDNEQDEAEFDGRIESIRGDAPNLILVVSGRTVHTSSATLVRRRGNVVGFDALRVQEEVEVEGALRTDGGVNASKITIEDEDDDDAREREVKGTVSGLSNLSSCPAVSFRVASQGVVTDSATRFDKVSCSGLKNGDRVEVKGVLESSGHLRAKRVKRDD